MAKAAYNPKRILERLRSHEPASALAGELGLRDSDVLLARELVRHVGEHQAAAAGHLPDALAQAVIEAAVQIEHAGFLKAVAESGTKAAAGAARRGLAILRSRGIEVEVSSPGEPVFRQEAKPEEMPCLLSTPDGSGDRVLWVPRPMRGGGLHLAVVLLSEDGGIGYVGGDEVSKKSFKRILEDITGKAAPRGVTLYEVPLSRARGIIAEARAHSKGGLSIEMEAQLSPLIGNPEDARPPFVEEPQAPEVEAQRVRESGAIHQEVEVRGWTPGPDATAALRRQLEEVQVSSLYVDARQRAEQAERVVERAMNEFFAKHREGWSRRLLLLAEAFRATGRPEQAVRAAAASRALAAKVAPGDIPFCRGVFEKLVPAGEEPRPGALRETDSGLIVPDAG